MLAQLTTTLDRGERTTALGNPIGDVVEDDKDARITLRVAIVGLETFTGDAVDVEQADMRVGLVAVRAQHRLVGGAPVRAKEFTDLIDHVQVALVAGTVTKRDHVVGSSRARHNAQIPIGGVIVRAQHDEYGRQQEKEE